MKLQRTIGFFVSVLSLLCSLPFDAAWSSRVASAFVDSVRLQARVPGGATVVVEARSDELGETITALNVTIGGKKVEVPRKAYADIRKPILESMEIAYVIGDPSKIEVHLDFGTPWAPPECPDSIENNELAIVFKGRMIQMRTVTNAGPDGKVSLDEY